MSNYYVNVHEPIIIVVLMLISTCIAIYTLTVNRQLTNYCNNYYLVLE